MRYHKATPENFNPPAPCGAGPSRGGGRPPSLISIHPPLAGRDDLLRDLRAEAGISIHPPLAGRDAFTQKVIPFGLISIHPPLAGRDIT